MTLAVHVAEESCFAASPTFVRSAGSQWPPFAPWFRDFMKNHGDCGFGVETFSKRVSAQPSPAALALAGRRTEQDGAEAHEQTPCIDVDDLPDVIAVGRRNRCGRPAGRRRLRPSRFLGRAVDAEAGEEDDDEAAGHCREASLRPGPGWEPCSRSSAFTERTMTPCDMRIATIGPVSGRP